MRYLRNDSYYSTGGPIFFYTGNEGDINDFAQNTGFMFDIAPKFNPLIIFAEHRSVLDLIKRTIRFFLYFSIKSFFIYLFGN